MQRGESRVRRARLALALLGMAALLAAACAPSQTHRSPTFGSQQVFHGMLDTGGAPDIATLDPAIAQDTASLEVISTLYDGLVTLDRNLKVEPWGARSWDISPDGLTYTFHLQPGQFFSDGAPVRASDYAYSMNRALDPCLASPVAQYLAPIKDAQSFSSEACRGGVLALAPGQTGSLVTTLLGDSIVANDSAGTLTVTLAQPAAYFLAALAYPTSYAVESSVVGSDRMSEQWVGTLSQGSPTGQGTSGMFYVARWDHSAGLIVLKRNPHWWGMASDKKPSLTEIDWTVFRTGAAAYAAYEAGHSPFDEAVVPPDQIAQTPGQRDQRQAPGLTTYAVALNWAEAPFDNLDARLAFCLAINRDALAAAVEPGGLLPSWHLMPQGMSSYNADLTGPDGVTSTQGNADKARAHWQAYLQTLHGAPVSEVKYYYGPSFSTPASAQKWAQTLQQQWQTVLGVNVTLLPLGSLLQGSQMLGQIQTPTWTVDYPDPRNFLSQLLLPGSPFNIQGADVPAATILMRAADANPDQTVRPQEYQQAEQLLVDQVGLCPLFQTVNHYLVRSYVHGWFEDARGIPPNDAWVGTYLAAH